MNDIHAIKPPIQTPILTQNLMRSLWFFFAIIFIFLILFYYFWKKRKLTKQKKVILQKVREKNNIDYKKITKEKLEDARKYIKLSEYKIFHLKASKAIREYLSCIYDENFFGMTTAEILNSKKIPDIAKKNIKKFFKLTDLSKFADKNQEKETANRVFELAFLIIK